MSTKEIEDINLNLIDAHEMVKNEQEKVKNEQENLENAKKKLENAKENLKKAEENLAKKFDEAKKFAEKNILKISSMQVSSDDGNKPSIRGKSEDDKSTPSNKLWSEYSDDESEPDKGSSSNPSVLKPISKLDNFNGEPDKVQGILLDLLKFGSGVIKYELDIIKIIKILLPEFIIFINGNYSDNNPYEDIFESFVDTKKNGATSYAHEAINKLQNLTDQQANKLIKDLTINVNGKNVKFISKCISRVSSFTKDSTSGAIIYLQDTKFLVYAKPDTDPDVIFLDICKHYAKIIIQIFVFNYKINDIGQQLESV